MDLFAVLHVILLKENLNEEFYLSVSKFLKNLVNLESSNNAIHIFSILMF